MLTVFLRMRNNKTHRARTPSLPLHFTKLARVFNDPYFCPCFRTCLHTSCGGGLLSAGVSYRFLLQTVWALPPLLLLLQLPRLVLVQAVGHADSHHCRHYGGCYPHAQQGPYPHGPRSSPYVPAPPGETPRCARPGATFCEAADHYPT